jgi:hypothetical protein
MGVLLDYGFLHSSNRKGREHAIVKRWIRAIEPLVDFAGGAWGLFFHF